MSEVGLGFEWPAWLQVHIRNATTPDRQRWVSFAMSIEEFKAAAAKKARENPHDEHAQQSAKKYASYAEPNGVNTRPDDPFWRQTHERQVDRENFLKRPHTFTVHTTFDPSQAISDIGHAISKIPVVGDIAHIAGEAVAAPFNLVKNIASGERLDHALVGALKDQVQIVKDVAPYAETVVSLVPGIGTGVAAMIGAGAALAEGKGIDEIGKAAIKGALPGGPAAAAVFDTAAKIAGGENVTKAALESARNLVPAGPLQKAFDIGTAVATGEKLQNVVARGVMSLAPDAIQAVVGVGQKAIASTPGLSNAIQGLTSDAQRGAQLAAGLLGHSGVSEKAFTAIRSKLAPAAKQGFDRVLDAQAHHLPWVSNVTGTPVSAELKAVTAELYRKALAARAAPHVPEPRALPKAAPHVPEPSKAPPVPPKPHELPTRSPGAPAAAAAKAPPVAVPEAPQGAPAPAAFTAPAPAQGAPTAPAVVWEPYPHVGALSAPPPHGHHGGHHGGHHEGHPLTRGGPRWGGGAPWWGVPYVPNEVVVDTTCRTWGNPIEIPPPMMTAARMALGASQWRPTTVRGPDGVLYLFTFENGAVTARPCASAVAG